MPLAVKVVVLEAKLDAAAAEDGGRRGLLERRALGDARIRWGGRCGDGRDSAFCDGLRCGLSSLCPRRAWSWPAAAATIRRR